MLSKEPSLQQLWILFNVSFPSSFSSYQIARWQLGIIKIHSRHGFHWFGSNKFTNLMVSFICPTSRIRYYTDCCFLEVTAGNRAAAVIAGLNVIIFTVITLLAHREKIQKKRDGQLKPSSTLSDPPSPGISDGNEKKLSLVDEEDVTPVIKY